MRNDSKQFMFLAIRWLTMTSVCIVVAACAQIVNPADTLRLEPVATISLEYPNRWDRNELAALSNDGTRLIDASSGARNIRVWDWKSREVVQRLLLNEEAAEGDDGKEHRWALKHSAGQELALSPDGRLVAACAGKTTMTRIWSLESGAIVADIPSRPHHVPGVEQEKVFGLVCDSISFSPDGQHMAILVNSGSRYQNDADYTTYMDVLHSYDMATRKYKNGMSAEDLPSQKYFPARTSGIAVFETKNWKLERFFYRLWSRQIFNSRPLFDAESKTVSAVIFDSPQLRPDDPLWFQRWIGNRIVRWDIATGEQLEERVMPQLAKSHLAGVWWTPLRGGREMWLRVNAKWKQTDAEAEQCKRRPPPPPSFVSDEQNNCAYEWSLAILNLDTGKFRYLAPFKKSAPPESGERIYEWARISPDGKRVVLVHSKGGIHARVSTVEVIDLETFQSKGGYSANVGIYEINFSASSRYFSTVFYTPRSFKSGYGRESAMIFKMP